MTMPSTPWIGIWSEAPDPLVADDDLTLAVASRRDCTPETVARELRLIDEHFDVDAVYLERD
ncbi:MAG: hypothetical protein V5A55_06015 [Halovenus sp.]